MLKEKRKRLFLIDQKRDADIFTLDITKTNYDFTSVCAQSTFILSLPSFNWDHHPLLFGLMIIRLLIVFKNDTSVFPFNKEPSVDERKIV